jgi:hypothetical protein
MMSRAYKRKLTDIVADLGGTNFGTEARTEQLSGADLAQCLLAVENGDSADVSAAGAKTLGVNASYGGNPNSAALSGADQERFAGDQ